MKSKKKERIKEVCILTEEGEEGSERYISYTLIACTAVVMALIIIILLIEILVGWGPIFEKICTVLGVA